MSTQMTDVLATNKRIVKDFYDLAFNQHRPQEAALKYLGKVYRQHNPGAGDGPEAFIAFAKGFVKAYPGLRFDLKRIIAEGDLVVTHSRMTLSAADRGSAVMDIFRLEKGKVVEHWDVLQQIPVESANSNTMF